MTVQAWLEKAADDKAPAPFERVRIVDEPFDVISPELPMTEANNTPAPPAKVGVKRKRAPNKVDKAKKIEKSKGGGNKRAEKPAKGLKITLKLNMKPAKPTRMKEVDSDGDTVAGWSDDDGDMGSAASSALTSLSSSPDRDVDHSSVPVANSWSSVHHERARTSAAMAIAGAKNANPNMIARAYEASSSSGTSSETDSNPDSRRRKRPPPQANIVRAPKHSAITVPRPDDLAIPNTPVETPLGTAQTWASSSQPASQTFQTFSYDGYSNVPPEFSRLPDDTIMQGFPPPYSHSPPGQRQRLPFHDPYAAPPFFPSQQPVHPMHLPQNTLPNHDPHNIFRSTNPVDQYAGGVYSPPKDDQRRFFGDASMEAHEHGLTMGRSYHPGFP